MGVEMKTESKEIPRNVMVLNPSKEDLEKWSLERIALEVIAKQAFTNETKETNARHTDN